MDQKIEELKKLLEQRKLEALATVEDVEKALRDRKDQLEEELNEIRNELGEVIEDVKVWLDSNGKTVIFGGLLFVFGMTIGFLAGHYYVI
jgi:archaellum component FlaC